MNWPLSIAIVGTPASFPLFTSFAFWEVFWSDTFTRCLAVVFGRSSTATQLPAIAISSWRCHHSRLMALPDVGTFCFALFEGEALWHHRLCLGHALQGAGIASPGGDVYEELWSDYASCLLAGPRGGPPDALRGLPRIAQRALAGMLRKTRHGCWSLVEAFLSVLCILRGGAHAR